MENSQSVVNLHLLLFMLWNDIKIIDNQPEMVISLTYIRSNLQIVQSLKLQPLDILIPTDICVRLCWYEAGI